MKLIDRRQLPRADIAFPVEYTSGSRKFRHKAANLGGGGLFVYAPQAPVPGTELSLRFRPARGAPTLRAKGKVRFSVPGAGFGVEFREISRASQRVLLRLIHRRTLGRRKLPRIPLVAQVQLGEEQSLAWVKDISLGGMFIETDQPAAAGGELQLRFNLPSEDSIVRARGLVTYDVERVGMGVQFVEASPEALKSIQAYVEKSLPRKKQKAGAAPAAAKRSNPRR